MKSKLNLLIVVSLFIVTTMSAQNVEKQAKQPKQAKTEIVVFSVSLDCQNCVNKVTKEISFEKGVKDLYVSLEDGIVAVKFQPTKTDKEKLKEALIKLEYEVSELQSREKLPDKWK
ncbi:MAG: cation transporter [Marinilabiliaceae bacterium]|nr:cation transporter [Marinilabiliaceae bacterium]